MFVLSFLGRTESKSMDETQSWETGRTVCEKDDGENDEKKYAFRRELVTSTAVVIQTTGHIVTEGDSSLVR